ncbi:MAG: universal stress protein [Bacteroidota bacterium]|jgi:nucleotide-binding universal stress UspA family protein
MSYKTILVHLNDKRRAEALLEPAIQLATRYNSHLIGLHVYAAMPAPPIPMPYASEVLGRVAADERANSDALRDIFSRLTTGGSFVAESQFLKVPHADLAPIVMRHGRAADLIIAGQTDPDWDLSPLLDFPERLALEGGRPVLVIPYAGHYPQIGRNVVVAWKASRESARAVFDALPLLKGADNVHILEIREKRAEESALRSDTSIAAALGRHGIKPTIHSSIASDIGVGDEILSRLADLDADLLVMGAYGHSRMRELVFGGVTRHIARHMTVPTLLSH